MDHATAPLSDWLEDCWQRLSRGVADRRSPARNPVLASVGMDGAAKARTVVLRAAQRSDSLLQVHTDTASAKVGEVQASPGVTLHVWDAKAHLQIRAEAQASVRQGAAAAEDWARVPEGAAQVYGGDPLPGGLLDDPADHTPGPDPERFCVLDCALIRLDLLWLGREGHRRAEFSRADDWAGQWIAP